MSSSISAAQATLIRLNQCFEYMSQSGLIVAASAPDSPPDVWNRLYPLMLQTGSAGCVWFTLAHELQFVLGASRLPVLWAPTTAAASDVEYANSLHQLPLYVLDSMRQFGIRAQWDGKPLSFILVSKS